VAGPAQLTFKAVPLPGAKGPVSLDYVAYEPAHARVWVPVGDTGSVDVFDVAAGTFTRVDGFKTGEREYKGRKRAAGPSAVAIGDGFAYIGDRASSEVCAVDLGTLKLGKCQKVAGGTDGVAYVSAGAAKELWVTAPRDQSIVVFDVSKPDTLKPKASIKFEGDPEGFAFDPSRGLFFTNLEDKNKTVAIDVKTHKPKGTWNLDCGPDGPRGVAADVGRGFVYVACTDRVLVLDGAHGGAKLSSLETGAGVDNIDWLEPQRLLYVAAGKAARVTIARIDDKGQATPVATGSSVEGARNGVADASGNAYVPDANGAQLLVFSYTP
jgi:DNA-binding beta-propeller fold protein YncE